MKFKASAIAVCTLIVSGCIAEGKVTGGGWILGSDGIRKANYGFNSSSCDGEVKGNFNYHDKAAGIKINGAVTATGQCVNSTDATDTNTNCSNTCSVGEYVVEFDYESKSQSSPGNGSGVACLTDGGNGNSADSVVVFLGSGPFAGYINSQDVSGGNIKAHNCPGTNGEAKGKGKNS